MTEIKEVKKATKKAAKPKNIEEVKVEEVTVRKTYRELRNELRSKKDHIEVEIVNLNSGETFYRDRESFVI